MSRRNLAAVVVVLAAIGALVVAGLGATNDDARQAPQLPTHVLSGHRADLASLRGRPALINFWASWCEPCRQEAPDLERLAKSARGRYAVVGIDWNDAADNARRFISRFGWTYPVLRDEGGTAGSRFGLHGLPTTFVLNARGDIVSTLFGPQTKEEFEQALAAAG